MHFKTLKPFHYQRSTEDANRNHFQHGQARIEFLRIENYRSYKASIEAMARQAGMMLGCSASNRENWQLTVGTAVEELEAWHFGDWETLRVCYPKLPALNPAKKQFREPDAIQGGTSEQVEKITKRREYYQGGLPKREIARKPGSALAPFRNRSKSFQACWRPAEAPSKH